MGKLRLVRVVDGNFRRSEVRNLYEWMDEAHTSLKENECVAFVSQRLQLIMFVHAERQLIDSAGNPTTSMCFSQKFRLADGKWDANGFFRACAMVGIDMADLRARFITYFKQRALKPKR